MSECKLLPCGHCESAMVNDQCGKPEHRYCASCHEGECNSDLQATIDSVYKLKAEADRKLETMTRERDEACNSYTQIKHDNVRLEADGMKLIDEQMLRAECAEKALTKSELQVRELEAVYARYQEKLGRAKAALRAVAQDAEKHSGWWSRTTAQTALDALDCAENRVDAPERNRETWMVTRACQEHKRLGSDYEFRPFWGPPVTPCRDCKYEKVLEAHRFGGVAEKRKGRCANCNHDEDEHKTPGGCVAAAIYCDCGSFKAKKV